MTQEQELILLELMNTTIDSMIKLLNTTNRKEEPADTPLCGTEHAHVPTGNSMSHTSKYLNADQRKIVLAYITNPTVQETIKALPPHRRASFIQNIMKAKYGINLSFYHATNILKEFCQE